MNTQPYISPLMPTAEVLHVFGDTLHPEISRRLESLENHSDTADQIRKLHEKLQDIAGMVRTAIDVLQESVTAIADGETEARTVKTRDTLRAVWYDTASRRYTQADQQLGNLAAMLDDLLELVNDIDGE